MTFGKSKLYTIIPDAYHFKSMYWTLFGRCFFLEIDLDCHPQEIIIFCLALQNLFIQIRTVR